MSPGSREQRPFAADDRQTDLEPARGEAPFDSALPPAPEPPEALRERRHAQLESGLVLDERQPDAQPFVRCAQCETDAPLGTRSCRTCGAALDTPEQQIFNHAFWLRRRAEQEQERTHQQQEALLAQAAGAPDLLELQPEIDEAVAEELRAGHRIAAGPQLRPGRDAPPGLRLFARIDDAGMRAWLLLGGLGLAGTLLWRAAHHRGGGIGPWLAAAGLLALFALLLPSLRARR